MASVPHTVVSGGHGLRASKDIIQVLGMAKARQACNVSQHEISMHEQVFDLRETGSLDLLMNGAVQVLQKEPVECAA